MIDRSMNKVQMKQNAVPTKFAAFPLHLQKIHFEESQFERQREGPKKLKQNAVPTLFDIPKPSPALKDRQRKGIGCPKSDSILAQMEIPAVENIIVKQEIEIEDAANTSASEEIKESLLNELQQTKIELQLAYSKINSLVAEKNELIQALDDAMATQNALFAAKSQLNDELKRTKSDLQLAYVDKDNIVAKKDELIPELDDAKGTNNSLFAAMSEKESEFSKVKKELQQAYSEINALRKEKECESSKVKRELQEAYSEVNALREEKEELAKKVSTTDFPQSIFQSEKELHFYTGLDSIKDFQVVLSLLSSVQSTTNCLSFDAQVLVVLIKLKWNFRNAYLAYRFNISMNSVQRICSTIIPILETKLELIVKSPINKALKRNIPHSFKNSVYENLYQRMQRFLKAKNEEEESNEPDLEQL